VHTWLWSVDKWPRPENFIFMQYLLNDVSNDLLGYSHYNHLGEEKWDKKWIKTLELSTSSCVMPTRSCASRNLGENHISTYIFMYDEHKVLHDARMAVFWNWGSANLEIFATFSSQILTFWRSKADKIDSRGLGTVVNILEARIHHLIILMYYFYKIDLCCVIKHIRV
jgi:hypothetical protein